MAVREWPSREEWAAKAEQATRTARTMYERLPADAEFTTDEEQAEAARLAQVLASGVRPLLNAEINRLKGLLPDRPKSGRARINWFLDLEGERYNTAAELASLEELRRDLASAAKTGAWGAVHWEVGRISSSYRAINLCDLLGDLEALDAIVNADHGRRHAEAKRLEDEAVAREMARRQTDEAWEKELEWRQRVESPRVIRT